MYVIRKQFNCSCSHQLIGLPSEHPCARNHGHNYVITAELASKWLSDVGFVQDYRELDSMKEYIDDVLDHNNLNDILEVNPTAENIAKHLFEIFKHEYPLLVAIEVSETAKTSARYQP